MELPLYLGIDGGGTNARICIADETGAFCGETAVRGGTNLTALSLEAVRNNLEKLAAKGLSAVGIPTDGVARVCLGSAGTKTPGCKNKLKKMLCKIFPHAEIWISNDSFPVLYGAFDEQAGAVVISGTGSICLAKNKEGKVFQTGGYGHIVGDEGSGYAIGLSVLKAVLRAYDGRAPKTVLTRLVEQKVGEIPEGIFKTVYRCSDGKAKIASFSVLCDEACAFGDIVAQKIIAVAAEELFSLFTAAVNQAGLSVQEQKKCVLTGGVGKNSENLRKKFAQIYAERIPGGKLTEEKYNAAEACALIACGKIRIQKEYFL